MSTSPVMVATVTPSSSRSVTVARAPASWFTSDGGPSGCFWVIATSVCRMRRSRVEAGEPAAHGDRGAGRALVDAEIVDESANERQAATAVTAPRRAPAAAIADAQLDRARVDAHADAEHRLDRTVRVTHGVARGLRARELEVGAHRPVKLW